jgi:hypothetical protein
MEAIVLRYGLFYGPGTWHPEPTRKPGLYVDAAAQAALLALTRGAPGIYNIADDAESSQLPKRGRNWASIRSSGCDAAQAIGGRGLSAYGHGWRGAERLAFVCACHARMATMLASVLTLSPTIGSSTNAYQPNSLPAARARSNS